MKKSAVITGASRGIGKATALAFAERGYDILVGYRARKEEARAVCREAEALGVRAVPFAADLSDAASCRRVIAKAIMTFGKVDVLVNNAGIALPMLLTETDEASFDRLTAIDEKAPFFLSQAAAKEMIAAGGGAIVNVSSMWGVVGAAGEAAYSASKAAIIGLTKALAKELAPSHIRVNCVAPGVIDTEMNACYDRATMDDLIARTPLGRLGTPRDVADAIVFLAEHPFITGQTLTVDGGFAG